MSLQQGSLFSWLRLHFIHGFTSAGVDNAAHFGGLLCGFALGIILYHGKKRLPS